MSWTTCRRRSGRWCSGGYAPSGADRCRPATAELHQLARSLDRQRPAAASLCEGLELTLTVTRLGEGGGCCRRWRRLTRWSR
jgi:hypothetical protein